MWLPAQALSFALLPPWWRVDIVGFLVFVCPFLNFASGKPVVGLSLDERALL